MAGSNSPGHRIKSPPAAISKQALQNPGQDLLQACVMIAQYIKCTDPQLHLTFRRWHSHQLGTLSRRWRKVGWCCGGAVLGHNGEAAMSSPLVDWGCLCDLLIKGSEALCFVQGIPDSVWPALLSKGGRVLELPMWREPDLWLILPL